MRVIVSSLNGHRVLAWHVSFLTGRDVATMLLTPALLLCCMGLMKRHPKHSASRLMEFFLIHIFVCCACAILFLVVSSHLRVPYYAHANL